MFNIDCHGIHGFKTLYATLLRSLGCCGGVRPLVGLVLAVQLLFWLRNLSFFQLLLLLFFGCPLFAFFSLRLVHLFTTSCQWLSIRHKLGGLLHLAGRDPCMSLCILIEAQPREILCLLLPCADRPSISLRQAQLYSATNHSTGGGLTQAHGFCFSSCSQLGDPVEVQRDAKLPQRLRFAPPIHHGLRSECCSPCSRSRLSRALPYLPTFHLFLSLSEARGYCAADQRRSESPCDHLLFTWKEEDWTGARPEMF